VTQDEEIFSRMTSRQRQVAKVIISGEGCDDLSMSARLGLRKGGLRKHVTALLDVTGTDNRTALAVFLLRRPVLTALVDGAVVQVHTRRI
jgi:DNA-binding NarL/FixJ family response regulator